MATSITGGVHEGKHYGKLLKMCAFAWGELVRESNSRQHTSSLHRRVIALVELFRELVFRTDFWSNRHLDSRNLSKRIALGKGLKAVFDETY